MSRSQRHKMLVSNYSSDCAIISEKVASPGYVRQPGPTYTVPKGPPGGPLQGSSLAGPAPTSAPDPRDLLTLLALGAIVSGGGPVEPPPDAPTPPETPPPETPENLPGQPGTRSFPIGPLSLSNIVFDSNDGDLSFTIDGLAADQIQVGDTVRIEATGVTAVNGDKVVTAVSDPPGTFWVDGNDPGGPIVAKGRVTVIAGGA